MTGALARVYESLMREAQFERLRNYAEAIGLPRTRADEVMVHLVARRQRVESYEAVARQCLMAEVAYRVGAFDMGLGSLVASSINAAAAIQAVSGVLGNSDQMAYDASPDDCWRCDAKPADGALGLCTTCRRDLTEK